MPATFIRVRNFEKFQHYKDRKPPWIKLYVSMLCSPDVHCLSDTSKWHVVAIMLLASQHDNKLPFRKDWIARTIQAKSRIKWDLLFSSSLIECYQDASNSLANCQQSADGETETYKEYKEEGDPPIVPLGDGIAPASASAVPSSVLLDIFKAKNKLLPDVLELTPDRQKKCRSRLGKNPSRFCEQFERAVLRCQEVPFLRGENPRNWKASFDWLIANDSNVVKVLEGRYDSNAGGKKESFNNLMEELSNAIPNRSAIRG